jgi:hypothetical protein
LLSPHNEGEGPRGGSLNTSPSFTPSRRRRRGGRGERREEEKERRRKEGEQEIKQE